MKQDRRSAELPVFVSDSRVKKLNKYISKLLTIIAGLKAELKEAKAALAKIEKGV